MRLSIVLVVLLVAGSAHAVELKNDSFQVGGTVFFQDGFVVGEVGAARFTAASAGVQLQKVRFLFGGGAGQRDITLRVYDDSAGTVAPGTEIFSGDFQVTASDTAISEIDLIADNVIVPQNFRIGVEFQTAGLPSIARDDNGNTAGRNFIFGIPGGWFDTTGLVAGDWIIRAEVSGGGPPAADAGPGAPDASPPGTPDGGTGGACTGNGDCAIGQYCDTANMSCTFDCRVDSDCGGGSDICNSLGQCIDGPGDGGGCGCRVSAGRRAPVVAGLAAALLALVVLRRRRRR